LPPPRVDSSSSGPGTGSFADHIPNTCCGRADAMSGRSPTLPAVVLDNLCSVLKTRPVAAALRLCHPAVCCEPCLEGIPRARLAIRRFELPIPTDRLELAGATVRPTCFARALAAAAKHVELDLDSIRLGPMRLQRSTHTLRPAARRRRSLIRRMVLAAEPQDKNLNKKSGLSSVQRRHLQSDPLVR